MMRVRVEVKLKSGHFDPEGDVTATALRDLGFRVNEVKVSKVYTLDLEAKSTEEAVRLAKDMCRKLLANPTKDDFTVEVLPGEERTPKKSK
ncbi:MAG: phosphoribosylformylglycinamidine synthase subunit PurS [Candidatus Methanomethyliaceae archaeon]|nr:phosphoribosylformylglycinamidine synthase subunit PurS [Candidatus Methanomethyliaceae archaeon]